MTKRTSSVILEILVLCVLALIGTAALGQDKLKPLIDDPGTECLDYQLDVVSLKTNNVQMFWKQNDCILVHLTNNPFLFKYELSFDEKPTAEDDPLGAFGKIIGVNVSSVSGSGATTDTTSTDKKSIANELKNAGDQFMSAMHASAPLSKADPNSAQLRTHLNAIWTASQRSDFQAAQKEAQAAQPLVQNTNDPGLKADFDQFESTLPSPPTQDQLKNWEDRVKAMEDDAKLIHVTLELVRDQYSNYAKDLEFALRPLSSPDTKLVEVQNKATDIERNAKDELICLTDARLDKTNSQLLCPEDAAVSVDSVSNMKLEERLVSFANRSKPIHEELSRSLPTEDETVSQLSDRLHSAGATVVFSACAVKAIRDNDLASLRTRIIAPLDSVLNSGISFEYKTAAKKREGPWGDPESVTMTLKRDAVSPFATVDGDSKTPASSTTSFTCSSDTTDMFDHGDNYGQLDDFFSDKPLAGGPANSYVRNQNKPVPVTKPGDQSTAQSGGKSTPKPTPAATDNIVLQQPWFFGRPRLVLSGGLTTGFLSKQEFQRSTNITGTGTGTTSNPVIGLKTDSKYRLAPMLYGHVLLPWYWRHDPEAFYATFGVTAKTDSQGTNPEFLLGLSRGFAQQRFFLTAGAYIGERQKLDGGLQVGQVIPSTLTGELPVTKGYHVGFGIGLSFRFASTKDPQTNSSNQSKSQSGGSGTKK